MSIIARSLFYAIGQERKFVVIYGMSVLVNILLNIPMISFFSYIGACITTIVSEVIVCLVVLYYIRTNLMKSNLFVIARKPMILGLIFALICYVFKTLNIHVLLAAVLVSAFYVGVIFSLKLISVERLKDLRSVV